MGLVFRTGQKPRGQIRAGLTMPACRPDHLRRGRVLAPTLNEAVMRVSFLAIAVALALGCSSNDNAASRKNAAGVIPPDGGPPKTDTVAIPGGDTGIGFDDLKYSVKLHRVLVPGGWTGTVNLVNPDTLEVTSIPGFTADASWASPTDDSRGVGPVEEGNGFVFAGDRSTSEVGVVDPVQKTVTKKVQLKGYPDYLGYVESTGELWVTEPFAGQIEILTGAKDGNPVSDAVIPITGIPESIVVDQTRGLVMTMHLTAGVVEAIDIKTRQSIGTWSTGCANSHGLVAIDEKRGFVFPGCLGNAHVAVLDLNNGGAILDSFDLGSGSTLVAFSSTLGHFYMRGDPGLPMAFLGVADDGKLTHLNTFDSVQKAHCLTADDVGGVWTCDWMKGAVVRFQDPYPNSLK